MPKLFIPKIPKSQTHITPQRVYDIIEAKWGWKKEEMYDPCPGYTPTKSACFFNGLIGHWQKKNYVNPPYLIKPLTKFVEMAVMEASEYGNESIMLLPSKTEQDWFQDLIWAGEYEIEWIRRRLKFTNDPHYAESRHFLVKIC